MNSRRLSTLDEVAAIKARTSGREAKDETRRGGRRIVPQVYREGTFHAFCWHAGYKGDDRNVHELHEEWSKPVEPEAKPIDPNSAAGNL